MIRPILFALFTAAALPAAEYKLAVTPATTAWGYYWAGAKPVLTIKSGDVVEIQCVSVGSPATLERAGLRDDQIEPEILRNFTQEVPPRGSRTGRPPSHRTDRD